MGFFLLWSEKYLLFPQFRQFCYNVTSYIYCWRLWGNLMFLSCHIIIKLSKIKDKGNLKAARAEWLIAHKGNPVRL